MNPENGLPPDLLTPQKHALTIELRLLLELPATYRHWANLRMNRYLQAARRSIQQHGGGIRGLCSVARRALKIIAAMGIRGLFSRLRSASAVRTMVADTSHEAPLPPASPLAAIDLRLGVMVHVFYVDLLEEFARSLECIPVPFTLLVSVVDGNSAEHVRARMAQLPNVKQVSVKVVENRGRDIAPLLVAFRDEILSLDVIGHIHTKKSLYTGSEQGPWRRYLLDSLYGSSQRLAWILGMFQSMPRLGLVYPETHQNVPLWAHTWLSNGPACDALAAQLGIQLEHNRYIDFPAGSMFWARVDAIKPLFDLGLRLQDFPPEHGQVDGTLQHAVERMFGQVTRQQGYRLGILPADGSLTLASEGMRNVHDALELSILQRMRLAALEATTVSVDVFDTLVVRPFLTPAASRAYLSWRLERSHGIRGFLQHREDAEAIMRNALQRDPTLAEIYRQLARQLKLEPADADMLMNAELEHERRQLRPRAGVVDALAQLNPPRLFALSDMYLDSTNLQQVLPKIVTSAISTWRVSCETGRRKDELQSWPDLAGQEGIAVSHWLHIGDNEHADIQLPQMAGLLPPVHVLRPAALFDVIPALRPLRHASGSKAPWPEQLWSGLVANRFVSLLDAAPQQLRGPLQLGAKDLGYVVLGPLLLDFLSAMLRTATQQGVRNVLFLSREGHLLHQAHERLRPFHHDAQKLEAHYFLASRRATLLPAMHHPQDLELLLEGNFNGSFHQLLLTRGGEALTDIIADCDPSLLERDVFLPEMASTIVDWLQPALPAILAAAGRARADYETYWSDLVTGDKTMVVDIGYAGTIQRNLSRLHAQALGGYYMALRARAQRQLQDGNWAHARHFDGRHEADEMTSPVLLNDLLLEALLGAPAGQFNGFATSGTSSIQPCFGPIELTAEGLQALAHVHQGALEFIDDICSMIGEDISEIELDAKGVLVPLQCLATGRWEADATLRLLATDDSFTGRGKVAAAGSPNS